MAGRRWSKFIEFSRPLLAAAAVSCLAKYLIMDKGGHGHIAFIIYAPDLELLYPITVLVRGRGRTLTLAIPKASAQR